MAQEVTVDMISDMRVLLQTLRDGGGPYPCPEAEFIERMRESKSVGKAVVTRALKQDSSLVNGKWGDTSIAAQGATVLAFGQLDAMSGKTMREIMF